MRQILSRCGLILVVLTGLAAGVAARLMWQPRVVAASGRPGPGTAEDPDKPTQPKRSTVAVAVPRGVDPDVWQLLQEHLKTGGWAATLDRLRSDGRGDLRSLVMRAWCEVDGTAALSWLADQPQDQWPGEAMWGWIVNHPALSWKVAVAKDNLALARVATGSSVALAADPKALREILDSSTGRMRSVALEMAGHFAGQDHKTGFLKLAAADPDAAARVLALIRQTRPGDSQALLAAWLDADPTVSDKLLANGSAKDRTMWQTLLVSHLAHNDPKAAEALLATMPTGTAKDTASAQFALARAETDPHAALALAATLGPGMAATSVRFAALKRLAETDPVAALAAAERIAASGATDPMGGDTRLSALLGVVDWNRSFALAVRTNGYSAMSMLNTKNPIEVANGVAFLRDFGATDPAAAARSVTILDRGHKDEIRALAEGAPDNPLTAAARIWLASQPEDVRVRGSRMLLPHMPDASVAQALSELDPSLVQPRMFSDTASGWARQEPERASQWVADMPTGPGRDAAIGGLVNTLIGEALRFEGWFDSSSRGYLTGNSPGDLIDYRAALVWAAAAGDSTVRQDLALKTARRWLDADPSAAAEGVRMIGLPADESQQLLRELGMSP